MDENLSQDLEAKYDSAKQKVIRYFECGHKQDKETDWHTYHGRSNLKTSRQNEAPAEMIPEEQSWLGECDNCIQYGKQSPSAAIDIEKKEATKVDVTKHVMQHIDRQEQARRVEGIDTISCQVLDDWTAFCRGKLFIPDDQDFFRRLRTFALDEINRRCPGDKKE